jgi:hypothetical protein
MKKILVIFFVLLFTTQAWAFPPWVPGGGSTITSIDGLAGGVLDTADVTIQKADPALILDGSTAGDTDFWLQLVADEDGSDDDTLQIGTGTTPGSNSKITVDKDGIIYGTEDATYSVAPYISLNANDDESGSVKIVGANVGGLGVGQTDHTSRINIKHNGATGDNGGEISTSLYALNLISHTNEWVNINDLIRAEGAGAGGKVLVNTTDSDGTPSVGTLTVKGDSADGTTLPFVIRDSDEANVLTVNSNGNIDANRLALADSMYTVKEKSFSWASGAFPLSKATEYGTQYNTLVFLTNEDFTFLFGGPFAIRDWDHGAQANPTIFIHSATDPNTDNTQWVSFTHDQTDGVITTGKGALRIDSATGYVGIETSDFDGTPPAGTLTVKGSTNDGSTLPFVVRDSDETNVLTVDSDGTLACGSHTLHENGVIYTYRLQVSSGFTPGTSTSTTYATNNLSVGRTQSAFGIGYETSTSDTAAGVINIEAQSAYASASTNIDGGNLTITAGAGASGSAGDADGGNVVIDGGVGYGTGDDGAVKLSTSQGYVEIGTPASAPTLSGNGRVAIYLDEAGHNLKVVVKYSDGTDKTATIAFD